MQLFNNDFHSMELEMLICYIMLNFRFTVLNHASISPSILIFDVASYVIPLSTFHLNARILPRIFSLFKTWKLKLRE
jgi:hypothetical protein